MTSKTSGHSPYFCEDGLLVDPRPIGHWSIRWCPNEEFDLPDEEREIEPDRLLYLITDEAENLRKWVSLGMKVRFEPGVRGSNSVFMFETTDPIVAARMVAEANICWWRSSIFEVEFEDDEIVFEASDDFARADGFQLPPGIHMRAHIIGSTDAENDAERLDSILETHGFELVCGAHGTYDWFISQQEMNTEQMHALEAEITAVQGISHCDIGPFDPSDICANPLCRPGPPEKPRRKKQRRKKERQPAQRVASEIARLFDDDPEARARGKWTEAEIVRMLLDPRVVGVGGFPPVIDAKIWTRVQVKQIADMGPEAYARCQLEILQEAFAGFADMLAAQIHETMDAELAEEEEVDPRSTEEIRQRHLRAKREHADDPLVVELADAGLALLDAEVALHDAPLGHRSKARPAVEAAKQRMDRAMAALRESNKDEQTAFLRGWKRPSGKRLH